jgi:hypothetical protein
MSHIAMSSNDNALDTTPVMARGFNACDTLAWTASTSRTSMSRTAGRKYCSRAEATEWARKCPVTATPVSPSSVSTSQKTNSRCSSRPKPLTFPFNRGMVIEIV